MSPSPTSRFHKNHRSDILSLSADVRVILMKTFIVITGYVQGRAHCLLPALGVISLVEISPVNCANLVYTSQACRGSGSTAPADRA